LGSSRSLSSRSTKDRRGYSKAHLLYLYVLPSSLVIEPELTSAPHSFNRAHLFESRHFPPHLLSSLRLCFVPQNLLDPLRYSNRRNDMVKSILQQGSSSSSESSIIIPFRQTTSKN